MSRINWSSEQQAVIRSRHQDVLVSAAAGSGKTAVLIERIYKKITDRENPVNVDDLLIVTFTENAAEEMKQRIRRRLIRAIDETEDDPEYRQLLRDQLIRLPQAQISTIHGFCQSVIRSWFTAIDFEPDVRVLADEGEQAMLKKECIDRLLDEEYDRDDPEFHDFVNAYAGKRSDRNIETMIQNLHSTARAFPNPADWLRESTMLYAPGDGTADGEFGTEELMGVIKDYIRFTSASAAATIRSALDDALSPGGPYTYEETLEDDLSFLQAINHAESFAKMRQLAAEHQGWPRLSNKKIEDLDDLVKTACKAKRDTVKNLIERHILKPLLWPDPEVQKKRLANAYRHGKELTRLVLQFDEIYAEAKHSRKVIDFSDMEHLALRILQTKDEQGNDYIAQYYREHFNEVMVDEYQDSNYLQDEIFRAVSGGRKHNLFMVGDVKQSIYRFREARPELFIRKQKVFTPYQEDGSSDDADQICIRLSSNFRSSAEVIGFVNDIFYKLFDKSIGGIDYDADTALYQGNHSFPEENDRCAEVWVIPRRTDPEQDGNGKLSPAELEAYCIAKRIRKLMEEQLITDKDTKQLRPVRYRDIVILARSLSDWGEELYETLASEGIPVFMVRKKGFYQTKEVGLLVEMLKLLDNAHQDIPLAAVMTSIIGSFTDDEMAAIRARGLDCDYFYEAAEACRDQEEPDELSLKVRAFYGMIEYYRKRAVYMPVHRLLRDLIDETGVGRYFEALPAGTQRSANLNMLITNAQGFSQTGYRGLSKFLEYIDEIDRNEVDYGEAGLLDETADVVRIMTIHKSKGLEYPVVIIAGMGKGFNMMDQSGSIVIQPQIGIGLEAKDTETREKGSTPVREIIRHQIECDDLGELMRVLYVAMTRAEQKLIMTGCLKYLDQDAWFDYYVRKGGTDHGRLSYETRINARSFYDWVLPIVTNGATDAKVFVADVPDQHEAFQYRHKKLDTLLESRMTEQEKELAEILRRQIDYRYPYEETRGLPLKVSVSDLKHGRSGAEVLIPEIRPQCVRKEGEFDPAAKGTANHKVLQRLDFKTVRDSAALDRALTQMVNEGYLDAGELDLIDCGRILRFLESDLCSRMACAGQLHREQPFVIGVDSHEIDESYPAGETVLVQGIIDAYFVENGSIVIADYKTDHVRTADVLIERYKVQLDWYGRALEDLTGMKVSEKIIYSLELSKEIPVT